MSFQTLSFLYRKDSQKPADNLQLFAIFAIVKLNNQTMRKYLSFVLVLALFANVSCIKELWQHKTEEEGVEEPFEGPQEEAGEWEPLSEEEESINLLPSDEGECPVTDYSEEELLQIDSIALDLLERNHLDTKGGNLIQINTIDGYIVEHIVWDAGVWGATHWAGDKIKCMYNAYRNAQGHKMINVVLQRDGGFPSGNAFLKLGTLNSGEVLCKVPLSAGQNYVAMQIDMDCAKFTVGKETRTVNLLPGYGILNLFPLLVYDNHYREYVNQVSIKSDPIVPVGWDGHDHHVGDLFGTINGVGVYHNGNSQDKDGNWRYNLSGNMAHQCVELCRRYLCTHYDLIKKLSDTWGDACEWPENRAKESKTLDKYIILSNDGSNQAREGDLIVFEYDDKEKYPYGHIGVIIKTKNDGKENYISFAHQNGKNANRPIGTVINRSGDFVKKVGIRSTVCFIRKDNDNEHPNGAVYEEPVVNPEEPTFDLSTDILDFGPVAKGKTLIRSFTVSNHGTAPLVISSITPPDGYRCSAKSLTIKAGADPVTIKAKFYPDKIGTIAGDCVLKSNMGTKKIRFRGEGVEVGNPPTDGLVAWYPFNGNANDQSGNGNDGTLAGESKEPVLSEDRHGRADGAYEFGGYSNRNWIVVPNSSSLQFTKAMTISFWMKLYGYDGMDGWGSYTSNGAFAAICKGGDGNATLPGLYIIVEKGENGEPLRVTANNSNGNAHYQSNHVFEVRAYSDISPVNVWTNVILTEDDDWVRVYINGSLALEEQCRPADFTKMNGQDLYFGMMGNRPSYCYWYPFNGQMDDIRIYNRAVSATEAAALAAE